MYRIFKQNRWDVPGGMSKLFLIMKLSVLFLMLGLMQVSASTFAQKVSLRLKNASLRQTLDQITVQTGYDYFVSDEVLKNAKPVTLNANSADLQKVLNAVFQNQDVTYRIDNKTIMVSVKETSILNELANYLNEKLLNIDVTGRVVGENSEPLPGAIIRIKNGNRSVLADESGRFVLTNVPENAPLEIVYIGYQTIETLAKKDLGIVTLKMTVAKLDEVEVSTGYQNLLKERAPGAYETINRETLEKRPVTNLSTALQGLVAGMQGKENADGSVQFIIRGNSSLYADRRPLIVVDGFPVTEADFSTINPNDVENVTVLKDAAAASIWGARSGNGVIVIATKRGKKASGLNIEASLYTRISDRTDLDQLLNNASSEDQVAYERMAYTNGWFFNKYAGSFQDIGKPLTLAQELLFANTAGKITNDQLNQSLDVLSQTNNKAQIGDLLLRRALQSQYNVSFSSGTEKFNTYASLLFEDNKTRYQGSQNKRYALNFGNDYKLTKFLSFNVALNLQYRDSETSGATIAELQQLSPYETLLDPNGNYSVNINNKNREQLALLPLAKFPYADWNYNLLREVNGRDYTNNDISARIQAGINLRILKGLTFDTKIQYERRKVDYSSYNGDDTYYVRDMVNTMVEYNNTTKVVGRNFIPKGGIENARNADNKGFVFRNQFSYLADFGSKHSINAIAGTEISQNRADTRLNPWQYGFSREKLQATVPPYGYGSSIDLFTNFLGQNSTLSGGNTTTLYSLDRYVSYYANAAYTYNSKYTVSGSIRSDASNFITDDPALRWSPLWSVGALWNLKRESFLQPVGFVNRLNMRLTYGRNGNVEKSSSTKAIVSLSTAPSTTTGTITATIADYGNPTLRWEKTQTTNLGLDFGLFDDKLTGKIDVYNKIGKDITGLVALPAAVGTTSQRFNNAGIINRGIELELGGNVKLPGIPVFYSTSFNYAYNKNSITDLFSPITTTPGYLEPTGSFVQDRPINPVYSFTYAGMVNGIPQIIGPRGLTVPITSTTIASDRNALNFLNYEGTATPPHTLGWYNTFRVKNFSASLLLIGTMGGVYRNPTFNYSAYMGSIKTYVNRFVKDVIAGREDIPTFANANDPNIYIWDRIVPYLSGLVESSSYIEAKELMIDYTLPKMWSSKMGSQNVRFFAQARDLGVIWAANKNGYNPSWLPGTDRPLSTYTFGVNVKF